MKKLLTVSMVLLVLCSVAQAGVIIAPVAGSASSEYTAASCYWWQSASGSGLSSSLSTGAAVPASWPTHLANTGLNWMSGAGDIVGAWIQYDLGASYNLDSMHVWNFNEISPYHTRGMKYVKVEYSADGTSWSTFNPSLYIAPSSANNAYTGQDFAFAASNVRYVKITNNQNWGDNNYVGLSEVRFVGTAVPEPATLALLGFGGICLLRRRKK